MTGNLPVSSSSISLVGHIPSAMPVTAASMPPMAPAAAPPPPPPPPPPPGPGGPKMSFKLKTKSEGVKKEEKKEEEEERKDETPEEKEERLKKEKEAEMKKKEAEMKKKRENLLRNLRMCLVGRFFSLLSFFPLFYFKKKILLNSSSYPFFPGPCFLSISFSS